MELVGYAALRGDGVSQICSITCRQRHDYRMTDKWSQSVLKLIRRHGMQIFIVSTQRYAKMLLRGPTDRIAVGQQVNMREGLLLFYSGPASFLELPKMVYRGGCGSALDAECAAPSARMSGSRSVRPRASRKER